MGSMKHIDLASREIKEILSKENLIFYNRPDHLEKTVLKRINSSREDKDKLTLSDYQHLRIFPTQMCLEIIDKSVNFVLENETTQQLLNLPPLEQELQHTMKLPFDPLFLNFESPIPFYSEENKKYLVKGVSLNWNWNCVKKTDTSDKIHSDKERPFLNGMVFFLSPEESYQYFSVGFYPNKFPEYHLSYGPFFDSNVIEMDTSEKGVLSLLANFIVNIVNYMNSTETVEAAPIYSSKKKKKAYEKKYNKKLPPDFYVLKIKNIKKYGKKGSKKSPYAYRFDVRGHFRYLKSKRYKKKQGMIIWIPPFKKGEGRYIPKTYVYENDVKFFEKATHLI